VNRRMLFIGLAVLVVFGVAWTFLLWRPAGDELSEAEVERRSTEDRLVTLQAQHARLLAIQSDLPRLQSGIESLRAAVPDEAELAEFLLAVDEAGKSSGVVLNSIAPTEPRMDSVTGLMIVDVSIASSGGYYQMLDFLNRLQDMHRVLTVETLGLSAMRSSEDPTSVPGIQVLLDSRIYLTGLDPSLGALVETAAQTPAEGS
jgi:type IV pilus assembly protein PilO